MTTSSPASSTVDDVAQAAVESPVRVSRSIMIGHVADDNDDDSFDLKNMHTINNPPPRVGGLLRANKKGDYESCINCWRTSCSFGSYR